MTRLLLLLTVLGPVACGDDITDTGLPNGKPCEDDSDCSSGFCFRDDQNPSICATPDGSDEAQPGSDTDQTSSGGD
ncbi:MAG: hypothetical protein KUG77_18150 [Nannocystaceae bacterium]|nr:hypothetical protein [Nannocystaceae bacterium]